MPGTFYKWMDDPVFAEAFKQAEKDARPSKYFETLGTPFIAGRDFTPDDEGRPPVAIINQAMARDYFGATTPSAVSSRFQGQTTPVEIVGVVGDAKYNDVHDTPTRTILAGKFCNASVL